MSPPIAELHAGVASVLCDEGDNVILVACNGSFLPCDQNPLSSKATCLLCKKNAKILSKELNLPLLWLNKQSLSADYKCIDDNVNTNITIGAQSTIASITRSPDEKYLNKFWNRYKCNLINTSTVLYLLLLEVITSESIEKIYLFNGRFAFAASALSAAKKCNIDYCVYDQEKDTSFRMFHNTSLHDMVENCSRAVKYYHSNTKRAQDVALRFVKKKRGGEKTYEKSYTEKQKTGTLELYLKNNDIGQFISIFPSSDDEYKYLSVAWGMEMVDQLESIATIAKNNPFIKLLVRMHPNMIGMPKQARDDYYTLGEKYKNIYVINPNDEISSYEVLDMSELVIVFCSTIGVESSYVGKKTIGIGPNPYLDLNIFPVYSNASDLNLGNCAISLPNKRSSIIWLNYLYTYSDKNKYLSWSGNNILYKNKNFHSGLFLYMLGLPSKIYLHLVLGKLFDTMYTKLMDAFPLGKK